MGMHYTLRNVLAVTLLPASGAQGIDALEDMNDYLSALADEANFPDHQAP